MTAPGSLVHPPYHVCFAVPDISAAMDELTAMVGASWATPIESVLGEWPYTLAFSAQAPHIELVSSVPGSPWWTTEPTFHHIGWWSSDLDDTVASWASAGGRMMFDGRQCGRQFAYVDGQHSGVRFEAVSDSQRPEFEQRWVQGGCPFADPTDTMRTSDL